jgi:hypothetical protein
MQVLVLYRHPTGIAMRPAIDAHLHALERALRKAGSDGQFVYHNSYDESPSLSVRSMEPDAVVLHTTFLCMRWSDQFGRFSWRYRWLRDLPCTKIAIPQDEYDHSEILDEWLDELRITDIFTNFDSVRRELLYPILRDSGVHFHEVLTGYIDEAMAAYAAGRARAVEERPVDIVYRASHLPYWFGAHGQLKHLIADVVQEHATRLSLRTDISTRYADVIYGDAWTDFLLSGRMVIGAESGSSALDRRGEVKAAFSTMLAQEPELSFQEASARLVPGWDGHDLGAISPRHFEAVITKTCQILVKGRYSGVLWPGRHYLALERDFSNLDEVLESSRDTALLTEIAERTYEEIYLSGNYTYDIFGTRLAAALEHARSPRTTRRVLTPLLARAAPAEDLIRRAGGRASSAGLSRLRAARLPSVSAATSRVRASVDGGESALLRRPRLETAFTRWNRTLHYGHLLRLAATPAAEPAIRPLLLRYARTGGWRHTALKSLARDLLRLGLARRERNFDELYSEDRLELVWDHADTGREVPIAVDRPDLGVIALGDTPYEFPALSELIRRYATARRGDAAG